MTKIHKLISMLAAAAFLLAACAPQAVAPATVDPNEIVKQVMTAVQGTVSVGQTQTAAAQPTATFTFTPVPPTATPILPSATPLVIPTATRSSGGGGGGGTTYSYSCDPDIGKRPRDNSVFKPGDSFDVKWTIVNTGTTTWEAGYDLAFYSGPQLTGATFFELPRMKPGDKYSIVMDAAAPMERGDYVMTWKMQGGFCYPYIAITVE
jgi:hypothetical protein